MSTPLSDKNHPAIGEPRPDDYPELRSAFQAWSAKDWSRMMGQCLLALGIERPIISRRPSGPGWAFQQEAAHVFVIVDQSRELISIESPLVRVPKTQRVQLLRTLLRLNYDDAGLARFCLRDATVVLRFSDGLNNVSPPKTVQAIKDVALLAEQYRHWLAVRFDAESLGTRNPGLQLDWSALGEPVALDPPPAPEAPPPMLAVDDLQLAQQAEGAALYEEPPLVLDLAEAVAPPSEPPEHAALCRLLESGLQLLVALRMAGSEAAPVLERAVVMVAHARHHEGCPDAVRLMLLRLFPPGQAPVPPRRGLLERMTSAHQPQQYVLEPLFREIVSRRAEVEAQPPVSLPPLPSAAEVKAHVGSVLGQLRSLPEIQALREMVALGALSEILARAQLSPTVRARLQQEVELTQDIQGARARSLEALLQRLAP